MDKIREYLRGGNGSAIVAGIVSSAVFVYFFDPLFSFLGRVIIWIGTRLSLGYLDRLYSEMAVGEMNYSYLIVVMILAGGIGIITGVEVASGDPPPDLPAPLQVFRSRRLNSICLVIIGAVFIADSHLRLKTQSSFNQHMAILAPEISDMEYKRIRADWASMKSRSDFMRLREKVEGLAKSRNLVLPSNKLYLF